MLPLIMNNDSQGTSKNLFDDSTMASHQLQQQQELENNNEDTNRPKQQQAERSSLLATNEINADSELSNHISSDHTETSKNHISFHSSGTKKGRRRQRHHGVDTDDNFASSSTAKQTQKCWIVYWKDQLITCLRRLLLELNPFNREWFSFIDHHPKKLVLDIPSTFVPSSSAALLTYFDQLDPKEQQRFPLSTECLSRRERRRIRSGNKQKYTGLQIDEPDEAHDVETWYDHSKDDDASTASSTNGSESSDDYESNNHNDGSFVLYPCVSFEHSNPSINLDTSIDDEELALGDADASSFWNTVSASATEKRAAVLNNDEQQHVEKCWPILLRRRNLILLWKVLLFCITINTIVLGVIKVARPGFYLAYLTHWSMTFCGLYVTVNLFNCYYFNNIQQPSMTDPENGKVPFLIKVTWFLFELASHTAAGAAFVFWPIRHLMDMPLTYNLVMNHGGIVILVLFDGMYVNRIPYRIVHWYTMILPIQVLYVLWSLIHDFLTDIGNPDRYHPDDPYSNDDALYPGVLEWTDKWPEAIATSCSILFLLGPGIVLGFWYLSIYPLPLSENFGNISYTRLRYHNYNISSNYDEVTRHPPSNVTTSRIVQEDDCHCDEYPQDQEEDDTIAKESI